MTSHVESPAGPALRATAAVAGLACLGAGLVTAYVAVRSLLGLTGVDAPAPYTLREILFVCVWLVFGLSAAAAGLSLLRSAWLGRRHDLIPGPTLYLAGVSLVIIGLFFVEARAPAAAAAAIVAGAALMFAEYRSITL